MLEGSGGGTVAGRGRKYKAWLVTWEGVGGHVTIPQKVAAVLPPRWSPERVRVLVEQLYATATYTPDEMLEFAVRGGNPYPAQYEWVRSPLGSGYVQASYKIRCGHNPCLYARRVEDVRAVSENLTWREVP